MRKSDLSCSRQRLLEICQEIGFGRIESLLIVGGEPVFDPPPRVLRDITFGKENGPRPERETGDFLLKTHAVEFFACLDEIGDGVIELLTVKHGLPFQMNVPVPV